jgi:tetratricopeptide (TPR) repeat protein
MEMEIVKPPIINKIPNKPNPKKQVLCLNMIVKNESHCIRETLECMSKYVNYYVICDTGSTDGTESVITEFMNGKNIPGEIHFHNWKDFGTNRTWAIRACYGKNIDYIWIIDADDILVGKMMLPPKLTSDGYTLTYGTSVTYERPQILKNDPALNWEYIDVLHEFLISRAKRPVQLKKLEAGKYYVESRRLGARNKVANKYYLDALTFEKVLATGKNPELKSRRLFYLAQSYRDAFMYEESINAYRRRVEHKETSHLDDIYKNVFGLESAPINNNNEEVYYSQLQIGILMDQLKYDYNIVIKELLKAAKMHSSRCEALFYIGIIYSRMENYEMAALYYKSASEKNLRPQDQLFVDRDVHNYKALYCAMMSHMQIGKLAEAKTLGEKLSIRIADNLVAADQLDHITKNLNFVMTTDKIAKPAPFEFTPLNNRKITCFFTGYNTIYTNDLAHIMSLDSIEQLVISVAERMAKTDQVFVFQNYSHVVQYNGITFLPLFEIPNLLKNPQFEIDTMIVVRYLYYLLEPVPAKNTILWAIDPYYIAYYKNSIIHDYGKNLVVQQRVTKYWANSMHHASKLIQYYNLDATRVEIVNLNNTSIMDWPIPNNIKKIKNQFIYTSPLVYNTDLLIKIFTKVRELIPNAELSIYRPAYDMTDYNRFEPERAKEFTYSMQCGYIKMHNSCTIDTIINAFMTSEYWLYPVQVEEAKCVSALYAKRANCKIVASRVGCLPEILGTDYYGLVDIESETNVFVNNFVNKIATFNES